MADSGQRILPVGLPGGIIKGDSSGGSDGWIRRGIYFHTVPVATYRMWRACTAGPTPEELVARGREFGLSEPRATYEELAAEDLLVVLSDDPEERKTALSTHRIHLLMPGLGSVADDKLAMGHDPAAPWARMDPLTYGILLASNDGRSIWAVCADAAKSANASVEQVAVGFADQLPRLLAGTLVALDVR